MDKFPSLSNKEAFILSYLLQNKKGYGLAMVKVSDGLLERSTIYKTLKRMTEKGYLQSRKEGESEDKAGPPRRVYEVTGKGAVLFNDWRRMIMKITLQPFKESKK